MLLQSPFPPCSEAAEPSFPYVLEAVGNLVGDVRQVEDQEERHAHQDMDDSERRAKHHHGHERDAAEGDRREMELGQDREQGKQGDDGRRLPPDDEAEQGVHVEDDERWQTSACQTRRELKAVSGKTAKSAERTMRCRGRRTLVRSGRAPAGQRGGMPRRRRCRPRDPVRWRTGSPSNRNTGDRDRPPSIRSADPAMGSWRQWRCWPRRKRPGPDRGRTRSCRPGRSGRLRQAPGSRRAPACLA